MQCNISLTVKQTQNGILKTSADKAVSTVQINLNDVNFGNISNH
jgi:hypothetical protein